MKACGFADKCRNAHYANQLTNIKYCSGCSDVVVDVRNHYTNKKRGRVCLFKHEKESLANYISRMHILPGSAPKIQQKTPPVKPTMTAVAAAPAPEVYVRSKPSVPSVVSLEMFPMLTVALKKGRSVKIVVNSKVEEPTVVEVVEVPVAKVEEPVIAKPTEPEPVAVVKPVEEPVKAEAAVSSTKKDKKKEYKKRKWLEAKMAEEAKLAEEKRLAEEKTEKNRQRKAARKARLAEELAKPPAPPAPAPAPREPTEEEMKKFVQQQMLRERINELKKGRTAKA